MLEDLIFISHIAIKSSIPVLLAALGEIYAERSGILNLGLEGMMLVGALAGFAVGMTVGHPWPAVLSAMAAAGIFSLIHAFFTVSLRSNQVLSGLALTILGAGLTSFLGRPLIGQRGLRIGSLPLPWLKDIPVLGEIFFQHNPLVYLAYILVPLGGLILFHTGWGLKIRAVGDDAPAADAAGVNVTAIRYGCTVIGGLLAGLAGCYLSLAYTPGWKENMTAGQGWIAIAMVIFATWNPWRVFWGALLFGGLTALQFYFQATGSELIPVYVLRMLPYLLTILVLIAVTGREAARRRAGPPRALGLPFYRED